MADLRFTIILLLFYFSYGYFILFSYLSFVYKRNCLSKLHTRAVNYHDFVVCLSDSASASDYIRRVTDMVAESNTFSITPMPVSAALGSSDSRRVLRLG